MNTIVFEKLSKLYGQIIGVNNISAEIESGVTAFLGPNGAGKSTLLQLITGQLKPSKGKILLLGQYIRNNHSVNRQLGYCPEADALYDHLTGFEFLVYMIRLHGFEKKLATDRALAVLEKMNILTAKDKKIGGYSKGMRQRLKVAQAFAHDPDIIILDEPLAGMDPLGRHETIQSIKQWGRSGKTVIVSSHILHEVEEMTNTILLMNHGNILAKGNIYEIRKLIEEHPLHVSIESDNIRLLTAKLMEFDDIISVQFDRDRNLVTVQTRRPDLFYKRLPPIAIENNIQIYSITSPDENLDAVFEYLVN